MKKPMLLVLAGTVWAQDPLPLREAVQLGLRQNQSITATSAGLRAATASKMR